MANPLYADTILIPNTWTQIWPLSKISGQVDMTGVLKKGMLLRVPGNFPAGTPNTKTCLYSHTSAPVNGIDISLGDSGTIPETTIFADVLQAVDSEVWVKGSAANTPLSIIVE